MQKHKVDNNKKAGTPQQLKTNYCGPLFVYITDFTWSLKVTFFRRFFICKNVLKKLSCYHDSYVRYFMFGKYNGFVSKARVSACMYFLVHGVAFKQGELVCLLL